ncbi:hypothetical protein BS47DRAFT_1386159 [Hydnum rufescens UP504]|uniref:Peptidase A1 domain-containing protein n=1 Tax=Hydnum rufescens UP504 TaxID=1448309 RepID=A0A9P6AF64_9AGAM|nr:hypothetical protein BS47DRAFT_1386159 [Hydnum rufescens UP504]
MATGLTLSLKKNNNWKRHGPKDVRLPSEMYARSVRKWGIKPTANTTFFIHNDLLKRRGETTSKSSKRRSFLSSLFRREGGKEQHDGSADLTTESSTEGTEVPAEDVQNDLEYVVPVTIGTPGVTLNLDFDTGSADLWVWSSFVKTTRQNLQGHTIYNPAKSTTAHATSGLTWNISYGDGSRASGNVYKDTVKLGTLSIPGQAVEVAIRLSSSFLSSNGSDGLLGLAFPSINTISPTQQKTPVEQLIEQGLITNPIFTVKLDKGDSSGFYTFGFIDDTVLPKSSPITYTSIDSSNGFWEFPSPKLKVGDTVVTRASGNTAIADTGTTLILLDDAALQSIYGAIPGAKLDHSLGGWVLPTNSTPPSLSFSVNGVWYSIPGTDLFFADAGNNTSFGSIQSRGRNPQDILGDVFLKRVYAIFDQTPGAPRIGFGQR